ncbi:hypothetical protein AX17_004676 [Amanita inopinata Kibby_2008]|nr:hypothetical protein AX17_004676 [Amanita inopinata Kibby_2008]
MRTPYSTPAAPNVPYFTPAQNPPAGKATSSQLDDIPKLFQPIKIRGVEFPNRIWLSPLCQYSAEDGKITPWHLAHLGGILTRGPGLTIVEATAVLPEGRITPNDAGIWDDSHIPPFSQIVEFAHSQSQKIAIQLAHAGRKASTKAPWISGDPVASEDVGGWPDNVWAPSPIKYHDKYTMPKELTREGIERVKQAFMDAAKRAVKAGFDAIEIHNAHGYLLHEFLSPVSNKRTDAYGGSFENRTRLTLEIVQGIRAVIPDSMPLLLRISATDWMEQVLPAGEPSWTSADTVRLAPLLFENGVDFLDVSTGGNHPRQKAQVKPGYQTSFARDVMEDVSLKTSTSGDAMNRRLLVGTVGLYTEAQQAEEALQKRWADVVLVGRSFMKNPGLVWEWADRLGVNISMANQLQWVFKGRAITVGNGKPKM